MADPATAAPADPADTSAASAPDAAGGDLSQGYVLELSCLPDGTYSVSGPEPLQEEAEEEEQGSSDGDDEGSEAGQSFDSIGAALKGVLSIIKANPMGGDAADQMEAGYAAR